MQEADPFSSPGAELRAETYALHEDDLGYGSSPASEYRAQLEEAVERVRERVQAAVDYLRTHRSDEIGADAVRLARQRPAETLAGAAALGFLIGALISALGTRKG